MKKGFINNIIRLILVLVFVMSYGTEARAFNCATDEEKQEIERRVREAIAEEKGNVNVDISDLGIKVNMYSNKYSKEYKDMMDFCTSLENTLDISFEMGNYKVKYMYIGPNTEPTERADKYGCGENLLTSINIGYDTYYTDEAGNVDINQLKLDKKTIKEEADYVISLVSDDMTDVEKALVIYDYLQATTNYSTDKSQAEDGADVYKNSDYDPISVFRNHVSVCNANAGAYAILLNSVGIKAIQVDSYSMNHSWTMLEIDGKWYHADVTWDDSNLSRYLGDNYCNNDMWDDNNCRHAYFLKSDEEMKNILNHYDWELTGQNGISDESVKKTPKAEESYAFSEYRFALNREEGIDGRMNNIGEYWYYYDANEGKIAKSKSVSGEEPVTYLDTVPDIISVFCYDKALYILNGSGVFEYDTETGNLRQFMDSKSFGENARINEICIYKDVFSYVVANPKDNKSDTLWDVEETKIDERIEFTTGQYTISEIKSMKVEEPKTETATEEITTEENTQTEQTTEGVTEKETEAYKSAYENKNDTIASANDNTLFRVALIAGLSLAGIGLLLIVISVIIRKKNKN